jgi:predicted outer membrane repeat protein
MSGLAVPTALGQTSVGGAILTDTTWTLAGAPYTALTPVTIGAGATLTIQPGVAVRFETGANLTVGAPALGPGTLVARGTAGSPITFQPAALPEWTGIVFEDLATDAVLDASGAYTGGSILEHAVVLDCFDASVSLRNSTPLLSDVRIENAITMDAGVEAALGAAHTLRLRRITVRGAAPGLLVSGGQGHVFEAIAVSGGPTDGVFIQRAPGATVLGLTTSGNGGSGAVLVDSPGARIDGGRAERNENVGVHVIDSQDATVANLAVHDNQDTGILVRGRSDRARIVDCVVTDHARSGGGLLLLADAGGAPHRTTILRGRFEGNLIGVGGAILISGADNVVIEGTAFLDNAADSFGGAVAADGSGGASSANLRIVGARFEGNLCGAFGGALALLSAPSARVIGCTFVGNRASSGGGAVYADAGSPGASFARDATTGAFNTFGGNDAMGMGEDIFNAVPLDASGGGAGDLDATCVDWGTGDLAQVHARQWDAMDDPALGRVIVEPLGPCPPPCKADLDGDGVLTAADFRAFQNAFAAMDPIADCDGDGRFTIFDFLAYINAFAAGCG